MECASFFYFQNYDLQPIHFSQYHYYTFHAHLHSYYLDLDIVYFLLNRCVVASHPETAVAVVGPPGFALASTFVVVEVDFPSLGLAVAHLYDSALALSSFGKCISAFLVDPEISLELDVALKHSLASWF